MTELANEAKATMEPTPVVVPEVKTKPAQQWLGYVSPVVTRLTGAMLDTRSVIEKRLGFCPMVEAAKLASRGLDAVAEGLQRAANGLRAFAALGKTEVAEPAPGSNSAQPPSAQA